MTKKGIIPDGNIPDSLRQKANKVFVTHTVDVLYSTSDNMLFITRQHAEWQAANLNDHTILTIKKETE